jgi:hypothetical protein
MAGIVSRRQARRVERPAEHFRKIPRWHIESTLSPWSGTKPDGGSYQGRMLDNIVDPDKDKVFHEVDHKNTTA